MEPEDGDNSSPKTSENNEKRRGSSKTDSDDGPQASKRERHESLMKNGESSQASGDAGNASTEKCSKDEDANVGEDGSSCSFPRRNSKNLRSYRRRDESSDDSSSSDGEMAPRTQRAGLPPPKRDTICWDDSDANESDSSAGVRAYGNALLVALRNEPDEDEENGGSDVLDSDDETDEQGSLGDNDSEQDFIVDFAGPSQWETEDVPDGKVIPCLNKEKPRHTWSVTKEVMSRQYGMRCRQQAPIRFTEKFAGSLHCVERLELMAKLKNHAGCVNTVQFNDTGEKLISGSDDKRVVVWNWSTGQTLLAYESGHTSNIVQARFLHECNDSHIVSCARDGQVRLAVLSTTGECKSTHRLAQHRRGAYKLATHPETPRNVLSCGEDGLVMSIDTRLKKARTIVTVMEGSKKIGLYSIHIHPTNYNEFCVSGHDRWIRIYDRRRISPDFSPMKRYCPSHLSTDASFTNVTSAVYSHDGTELIGSYNDENIYLFDTRHPDRAKYVHKYEGHRNSATVKGVNFFGPNSEFVISGSDCGNIFFWEKHTESIVQFMRGDEMGVVNALVMHPQLPILATSGLDNDVKIWVPSCEVAPDFAKLSLRKAVSNNLRSQSNQHRSLFDSLDFNARSIRMSDARAQLFIEALRRGAVQPYLSSTDSSDDSDHPSQCPPS